MPTCSKLPPTTLTILTDGPIRDGFLSVVFMVGIAASPNEGGHVSAGIGPYQNACGALCNPGLPVNGTPVVLPVTLGVPLELSLSGITDAGIEDDSFRIDLSESLSFSFFEADGTTPVGWTDISSAPEPNAAWLSLVSIAFVAIRKRLGKPRMRTT